MRLTATLLTAAGVLTIADHYALADDIPANKPAIQKGLAWLVKQQNKDGSWSSRDQSTDVAGTAMAGLALLMEGSTATKGKHAEQIRKAIDWMRENSSQPKACLQRLVPSRMASSR